MSSSDPRVPKRALISPEIREETATLTRNLSNNDLWRLILRLFGPEFLHKKSELLLKDFVLNALQGLFILDSVLTLQLSELLVLVKGALSYGLKQLARCFNVRLFFSPDILDNLSHQLAGGFTSFV